MKTRNYILSSLIAGSIGLGLQSCGPAYIAIVPARPVIIRPVSPYVGAVWIDGDYRGNNYSPGYWGRPRHGRTYYAGEWKQGPRGNYWVHGKWK